MTETSLIQARVDTELKNDASDLFDSLGLDMTTAIAVTHTWKSAAAW